MLGARRRRFLGRDCAPEGSFFFDVTAHGVNYYPGTPNNTVSGATVRLKPSQNRTTSWAFCVFSNGQWYASRGYNGPWVALAPEFIPMPLLQVPVRYYRRPPAEWRAWHHDAPPQWAPAWGHRWQERRQGGQAQPRFEQREERRDDRRDERREERRDDRRDDRRGEGRR